jgi:hypothetical protein
MSPLLREINPIFYTTINNDDNFKIKPTLNIYVDVKKYLNIYGYYNIYKPLTEIIINKSIVNNKLIIYNNINKINKSLIFKIIQINYPDKLKNNSNIISDIDWNSIIDNILIKESNKNINIIEYKNFLINNILEFKKGICQIINTINPKEIYINYTTTFGNVSGNIDILCDNVLIDISPNLDCCTICEKILYTYLLKKNNYNITNIIIYDPINGIKNDFNISKINIIKFKKIFYNLSDNN